jgi:hypothetical protein
MAGVGAGVGAPIQCASSDTELLEVDRIVRGEIGGDGVEDPEGLVSCGFEWFRVLVANDSEDVPLPPLPPPFIDFCPVDRCRFVSVADIVVVLVLALEEKVGVDLEIIIDPRDDGEDPRLDAELVVDDGMLVAGVTAIGLLAGGA